MNNIFSEFTKYIAAFIILLFRLFPIKQNKLFFVSYYGSQYSCNPKYITEYMVENQLLDRFNVVWVINSKEKRKSETRFKTVRAMSLKYFYDMVTAKVIVTNHRMPSHFKKRKHQYYIQTWHSSLRLKSIEKDAQDNLPPAYVELAKKDSVQCNLLVSGCKKSTEIFNQSFWYKGEIFGMGTPRNDVLVKDNNSKSKQIKTRLCLPHSQKIILYAPTFRNDQSLNTHQLNYEHLLNILSLKYSGEWTFLIKHHPHYIEKMKGDVFPDGVINVTDYDDTQELLSITDILITDFSSLMFDFAITGRPCYLYTPDLTSYVKRERKLYFELNELPFLQVNSEEELIKELVLFNKEVYSKELEGFLNNVGSYENGNASCEITRRILTVCEKKEVSSLEVS